ncbi:MAG: FAD-binding oxidoreductase [Myxococcales bacterium]
MTTLQARTINDTKKTLGEEQLQMLATQTRGELITSHDTGYDEARCIYNAMIDRRPALINRCSDVADVIASVQFAARNDLLTAIRGGGHNGPGLALCDHGLVIDLSAMNGVRVDPEEETVRVQAGCVWGDVDHATHAFGMATPSGIISTTGVAGLTLGGGHGYLTRKYGLTVDNLVEADVVLADGSFVTASERDHPDLFWALRGGGGNFGVVTSFKFKLHPVGTVYGGPMFWPLDKAQEVLEWYRDFLPKASRDLYGFFAFLRVPPAEPFPEHLHTKNMCGIVWCYTGELGQAEEVFEPIRSRFGEPAFDLVGPIPYPALNSMHDGLYPPGLQWYWKGDFIREINDQAVAEHMAHGTEIPTLHSTMHLYPVDGAVHDVGAEDTAFGYRDVHWSMVIAGVDPNPEKQAEITQWARRYWEAIHPHSAGGSYQNFMMEEGPERVRATYGDNYERLAQAKAKYDPNNFFRVNQNIEPG